MDALASSSSSYLFAASVSTSGYEPSQEQRTQPQQGGKLLRLCRRLRLRFRLGPKVHPQEQQDTNTEFIHNNTKFIHKIKIIKYRGLSTSVILQNDSGPSPLLAICNYLLLSDKLTLSPNISEVSQDELLSVVTKRLTDSNSNVNNIADAIGLLPRLATGIVVDTKFRRIDDFEFTHELALFELLDIPLYHGWIVDPQNYETADAIGSKSCNAILKELEALQGQGTGYSRTCDSPTAWKGDLEEEEEAKVQRVLKLSEADSVASVAGSLEKEVDSLGEMASSKNTTDACSEMAKSEMTSQQGKIISKFVVNSASQLTAHGLLCLQNGLKEMESCIFTRNNQFNTMVKYDGELYLLPTDGRRLDQPSIWEKLELNGGHIDVEEGFVTRNLCHRIKYASASRPDIHARGTRLSKCSFWYDWQDHSGTIYFINAVTQAGLTLKSDPRLITLVLWEKSRREHLQYSRCQAQMKSVQQVSDATNSGLVVGPQRGRCSCSSSSSTPKADSKSE